ncbi:phosphatidylglycerophosphatase and protein-tyrosine phosphatase 1-like isoform X4 [Anneissia japonica]|uniref:phosphatidylglycerophosphatase and protein-tyrosine phosphatase 1-like isoform X3 n=1 Tax=Anneissia japonica TaxID=1529436 RepID=UPI001425B593|nr:phosphatidylglycerophosphatase and protein-tyrosine phosphatase 1-like isoform X3 [Anneissia japonica]XP_033117311.1 phosphatidylglycerophosphatase and protein-tyrosine phosphatase 1-like isoform X4 [Anneissia japonica]
MPVAKAVFYPTLFYNVLMSKVSSRRWFDRITENVILGALPFRSDAQKLVKTEGVKGVITMNEAYELHYAPTADEWKMLGVSQMHLPTVDFTEAPSMEFLESGVGFIEEHAERDESVYVHCKAGRTRSATLVCCYLMKINLWTPQDAQNFVIAKRPHIVLKEHHFRAMYRYFDKHVKPFRKMSDEEREKKKEQLLKNRNSVRVDEEDKSSYEINRDSVKS